MPRKRKRHHAGKRRHGGGHKRHHKMGMLNLKTDNNLLMLGLGAIAGGVIKRVGVTFANKGFSSAGITVSDKAMNIGSLLLGGALFYLVDTPLVRGLGAGIATAGVYDLSSGLKLSGIGAAPLVPFMPKPNMSGASNTPNIAGANVYQFPRPAGVGATRRFAGSHLR